MSYELYAQIPKQQICLDRQYSALLRWAAYIGALPIPTEKPSVDWVEQRIVASQIPIQTNTYVNNTIGYTVESQDVQTNIHDFLNSFPSPAVAAAMDANVDSALAVGMPMFCATYVTDQSVQQWYQDNGFGEEVAPV